ncbi:hypothetical protein WA026_012535 [Henosepilachna vigintioctopunctata]|uniref:Uncharacterized protein n=1 Tax=Henosepilachna vigintioctopunctata TaxID=420089 RepID=A0AAW1U6F6_9CUCU
MGENPKEDLECLRKALISEAEGCRPYGSRQPSARRQRVVDYHRAQDLYKKIRASVSEILDGPMSSTVGERPVSAEIAAYYRVKISVGSQADDQTLSESRRN